MKYLNIITLLVFFAFVTSSCQEQIEFSNKVFEPFNNHTIKSVVFELSIIDGKVKGTSLQLVDDDYIERNILGTINGSRLTLKERSKDSITGEFDGTINQLVDKTYKINGSWMTIQNSQELELDLIFHESKKTLSAYKAEAKASKNNFARLGSIVKQGFETVSKAGKKALEVGKDVSTDIKENPFVKEKVEDFKSALEAAKQKAQDANSQD